MGKWLPGQSGHPDGYSRKKRFQDQINAFVDKLSKEEQTKDELARIAYAMATGRTDLLRNVNTGEILKPDFDWFKFLIEHIEGRLVPDEVYPNIQIIVERREKDEAIRQREQEWEERRKFNERLPLDYPRATPPVSGDDFSTS